MRIAQRLAPLAAQDARAVRAAWAMRGEAAEVLRSRFNIDLDRNCFRCLRNGEWLNDEVINFYLGMLQERSDAEVMAAPGGAAKRRVWFANTFFLTKLRENGYCYANVQRWMRGRRWTKAGQPTVEIMDVLAMDLIIIPCHMSRTHWTCIVVDVPARTVTHYDSLGRAGGTAHDDLKRVVRWLCDEVRDKRGTSMKASEWQKIDLGEGAPRQRNGW